MLGSFGSGAWRHDRFISLQWLVDAGITDRPSSHHIPVWPTLESATYRCLATLCAWQQRGREGCRSSLGDPSILLSKLSFSGMIKLYCMTIPSGSTIEPLPQQSLLNASSDKPIVISLVYFLQNAGYLSMLFILQLTCSASKTSQLKNK